MWHDGGIFAPHDALDIEVHMGGIVSLRDIYPEVPEWFDIIYFPAGMLCPASTVLYFYYNSIRSAREAERRFWAFILRAEYALLFTASWCNQAERGQRGYILLLETVDWLEQHLNLDMPIDADTTNGEGEFTDV